jgi:hypothetical protein
MSSSVVATTPHLYGGHDDEGRRSRKEGGVTMRLENTQPSGNYANYNDAPHHEDSGDDKDTPRKLWLGMYMDELMKEEPSFDYAPVVLPWRIGLFLLTSTITQNLSYCIASYLTTYMYAPGGFTLKQQKQFNSLVYYMLYLGPVFGLAVDLVRIFRERFRPVIIIACVINAVIGFVCFATKQVPHQYGSCLMLAWLMEVVVMFIYIPMNAVVINYGNRAVESPDETSARIGSLMAQAMVWRTVGSLIYTIFREFAYGKYSHPYVDNRWFCLIAAIFSCVLIFQVIFLTKRAYYTDFRRVSLKSAEQVRFYRNALTLGKDAVSNRVEATGSKFMFILCFTFIYFMLPDPLYNTRWQFELPMTTQFSVGLGHANNILSAIGAVLGALAYALWMFFAQRSEATHGKMYRANPFIIVLAGCGAWAFGIFFHFFGQMGSNHDNFGWKVFIPIESVVVGATLRFAFMPSLSLAAMQAPRFFEATAFQLYSVCTSGGGVVSSAVTTDFMNNLGVTVKSGYWKALLLFLVFRFVPMVVAGSLPKFREDETIPHTKDEHEPLDEMNSDGEAPATKPIESEMSTHREA